MDRKKFILDIVSEAMKNGIGEMSIPSLYFIHYSFKDNTTKYLKETNSLIDFLGDVTAKVDADIAKEIIKCAEELVAEELVNKLEKSILDEGLSKESLETLRANVEGMLEEDRKSIKKEEKTEEEIKEELEKMIEKILPTKDFELTVKKVKIEDD